MPQPVDKEIKKLKQQLDLYKSYFKSVIHQRKDKIAKYSAYLNCARRLATLYHGIGRYNEAYNMINLAILNKYGDQLTFSDNPERMPVLGELVLYAKATKNEMHVVSALQRQSTWANAEYYLSEASMAVNASIQLIQIFVTRGEFFNARICGERFIQSEEYSRLTIGTLKFQFSESLGDVYLRLGQWMKAQSYYQQAFSMSTLLLSSLNETMRLQIMLKLAFTLAVNDELTEALFICLTLHVERLSSFKQKSRLRFLSSQQGQDLHKELLDLICLCDIPQLNWFEAIAESVLNNISMTP